MSAGVDPPRGAPLGPAPLPLITGSNTVPGGGNAQERLLPVLCGPALLPPHPVQLTPWPVLLWEPAVLLSFLRLAPGLCTYCPHSQKHCSLHPAAPAFPADLRFDALSQGGLSLCCPTLSQLAPLNPCLCGSLSKPPQKAIHDYPRAPEFCRVSKCITAIVSAAPPGLGPLKLPLCVAPPPMARSPLHLSRASGLVLACRASNHRGRPDGLHGDQDGARGPHLPQHGCAGPGCVLEQGGCPAGGQGEWLPRLTFWYVRGKISLALLTLHCVTQRSPSPPWASVSSLGTAVLRPCRGPEARG